MNYPHGHHHRDHNREEEEYPPPPPTHHTYERQEEDYPPQPPPPHHTYEAPPPPYTNPIQSHQHYNPNLGHQQEDTYSDPRYRTSPPRPTHRFESQPEYTHVQHVSHEFNNQGFQPNPSEFRPTQRFESQPEYPHVQHVSHEITNQPNPSEVRHETHHQENQPHSHGISSFFHHQSHGSDSEISKKPTFRVYSKAEMGYSLTIRNGQVILARSDPNDMFQHWIKDEKFSTRVKDEEGFPCFSLINKATGQAMKHSIGATKPVQLIPYNANALDESVLWTESKDLGDGFRCIRMVNNIRLNLDALNGDENHGGVHDGTTIVLWEWKKGPNQRWKITPY